MMLYNWKERISTLLKRTKLMVTRINDIFLEIEKTDGEAYVRNEDMNKRLDNITHKLDRILEMKEGMNES